jgi:hypothetical protein
MKRFIIPGTALLVLLFIGICSIKKSANVTNENIPAVAVKKPASVMNEPKIHKVKISEGIKTPVIEKVEAPEKKEVKAPEADQIIIPKSANEVYADYLEGFVVGKKNLGDTEDSGLDKYHYYLYVRTSTGAVKMYRTSEGKFNMVNNGDRILYRKSKSDKVIKVQDDKWK